MKLMIRLCFVLLLLMTSVSSSKAQPTTDLSGYSLHVQFKRSEKPILLYLTGDGGWNSFSESLIAELNRNGYPTIALDTRKYFWDQKTPDQFAKDISVILSVYFKAWNKSSFSIIGYSFGADVASFLPGHLPDPLASKINSMVLLSPGQSTGYVVKLKNMLNFGSGTKEKYKVYPEILKSNSPVLCIFGKDEESEFYPLIKETAKIRKLMIPGSHRYDDNVQVATKAVMSGL